MATEIGSYGIVAVAPSTSGAIICGTCGRAWLEDITPAGRCPWEYEHQHGEIQPGVLYVVEQPEWDSFTLYAWTPDGEGMLWYDSEEEARRDSLETLVGKVYVTEAELEEMRYGS